MYAIRSYYGVELGINTIVPIITDRTIIRLDEKTAEKKVIRWQKIVEGAAKQSGRNSIPDIKPPEKFENIFKYNKNRITSYNVCYTKLLRAY